MYTATYKEMIM